MASQSLYRKWRSQTFTELVGQEAVVRTLKNALKSGSLAHAYLFTGPRGTGKTTMARLLAKTINCTNPKNDEPCNECEQCREITAGNSFNVIEIDAASNRGIDSIRELREKVMMPPSTGRYKVYILDEAHMLTTEAFNALLKTLEEPPAHAIFVMATTDVHKMLPTVLSRCQRFDFKRFSVRQIVDHLRFVAEHEHIQLEQGAAELLARAAAGGMRDALSLLDQATAYSGQTISLAQVQAMLGVADPRAIQKFIAHVADLDSRAGLHLIHELSEAGADLRQINTQVMDYWRAMMLAKNGANIGTILDVTEEEVAEINEMAQHFSLEELPECARIFAQNDLMQKNLGTPQLGLELAFLSCIDRHRQAQSGPSLAPSRTAAPQPARPTPSQPIPASSQPRTPSAATPARTPPPAPVESRIPPRAELTSAPPPEPPAPTAQTGEALPDWDDVPYTDIAEEEEPIAPAQTAPEAASVPTPPSPIESASSESAEQAPSLTVQDVKEKWELIKRRIKTKTREDGPMVAAVLNNYTIVGVEGTNELPTVVIRATGDFHYNAIHKKEKRQKIVEWALQLELEQECRLRLLPPGPGGFSGAIPPPPFPPTNDTPNTVDARSANTRAATPARRSAPHHEPPAPQSPPAQPQQNGQHATGNGKPYSSVSNASVSAPLARTTVVRENSNVTPSAAKNTSSESRQGSVEKKAKGDPVVQEVMRMFKAELKEIKLK